MTDPNNKKSDYKKTKIGLIPDDWDCVHLEDAAKVVLSNVDKKMYEGQKPALLCNYTDVYYNKYITKTIDFMKATASEREFERFSLLQDDVVITKDSEDRNDIAVSALVTEKLANVLCGYHLAIIRPNPAKLRGAFFNKYLELHPVKHYFSTLANGVTRFGLTDQSIRRSLVFLPPLHEQKKIADILGEWDSAIFETEKLISLKKKLKKALCQQLLTGKHRFKGFKKPWKEYRLSDIVKIVERPVEWDEDKLYRLASVRRWSGGMFIREERNGHQIKVKKLRTIKEGDFLISHIQSAYGSMALVSREFDGMYISELYTVLLPKNPDDFDIRYLAYMSQDKYMWHLAYLASNGFFAERLRLNFNPEDFLKHKIKIPADIKEQGMIIEILNSISNKIALLDQKLELLKQQKRGLMQKLLTGKIRVRILKKRKT
ncbi:MAG: restriction endonuclease subunit S [Planctomycetota bacterium]